MNPFNLNELYLYLKLKELNGDEEWDIVSSRPGIGIMRAYQTIWIGGEPCHRMVQYDLRHTITVGGTKYGKKWFVSHFSPSARLPTEAAPFKVPMPFYDLEIEDEK